MDSNLIHKPEPGNGRRKIALALAAVAVTSLLLASQASAKPSKGKRGGQVRTESVVGVVTTVVAVVTTVEPIVTSTTLAEPSWGEPRGVRWR
jgi:hypothetical protein